MSSSTTIWSSTGSPRFDKRRRSFSEQIHQDECCEEPSVILQSLEASEFLQRQPARQWRIPLTRSIIINQSKSDIDALGGSIRVH